ncbi:MAG: TlpA family protein disulfide reductase [Cytophagales bacterium]|nr:TlpA family protein disulfide reductase [Cytophagales bacterium]
MQKILHLSISILLINMMFFRCQQSGNPETILSGSVKGVEADSLKITYYKTYTWEGPENLWIPLDSVGQFTTTLPVNSLKEFRTRQSRVVLKTGWKTTMNIYMNAEGEMDSTTFDGDGAEENEVYNNNLTLSFNAYNDMNKEPGEFIAFLDSISQLMKTNVDRLKDADQEFVAMLRNNIAYHKMYCWESYAEQKFDYAGKERPNTLKAYSSRFDKLMVFDNAELLNSLFYKSMLEDHFKEMVRDSINFDALLEANKGDQEKAKEDYNKISFNLMLDLADSIIPNPEIKSYIYCNAFYNAFLRNIGLQLIESFKQNYTGRIREVVTDTLIINYIASQINHLEKLSPGMPAPAFSYPDTTGKQVSLSDFKGKYVYIDVWATWCRPCIREIPKLKELEKDFGDEIAFISVSVDNEKETWHKYVREKELTGIQILSQGGSKAEIMDLYMIQGIPRFIMVDPDGNLVDADASKPSYDKTKKLFEEWTGREVVDTEPI